MNEINFTGSYKEWTAYLRYKLHNIKYHLNKMRGEEERPFKSVENQGNNITTGKIESVYSVIESLELLLNDIGNE